MVLDVYDIKNKRTLPSSSYDAVACLLSSEVSPGTGHVNTGTLQNEMCVRVLKMAATDKKPVVMMQSMSFRDDAELIENMVNASEGAVKRTLQGFFQTKPLTVIASYASHAAINIYAEIVGDEDRNGLDATRDDMPRHLSCCGLKYRGYLGYERVSGQGIAGRLYQSVKQSHLLHMEFGDTFNWEARKGTIGHAHKFLFIISEHTFASDQSMKEFSFALQEGKDIILIRDFHFLDTSDPLKGQVGDLVRMHGDTRPWKIQSVAESTQGIVEYSIACIGDAGLTNVVKSSNFVALCNQADGSKTKAKGWDFYIIGNPPSLRQSLQKGFLEEKDIIRAMRYTRARQLFCLPENLRVGNRRKMSALFDCTLWQLLSESCIYILYAVQQVPSLRVGEHHNVQC